MTMGTPHKLDVKKVQALTAQGMSDADIARHQRVCQSTVTRFLAKTRAFANDIKTFRTDRAAIFSRVQAKALSIQEQIIDGLDGNTDSLSPSSKSGLLFAMNAVLGTNYDKERLETGQSTSNQSVMTSMLGTSVKSLYAPPAPPAARVSKRYTKAVPQADPDHVG